jgi:membrane fusion protein (multidrug efflux system)
MADFWKGPRRWVVAGAVVVLAGGAFGAWRYLYPRESTEDAQVTGHVTPVSSRVAGTVTAVRVHDNQAVRAGEVLIEIDPHDYQIAVQRAEANLAAAEASAKGARAEIPMTSTTSGSQVHLAQAATGSAEAAQHAADREVEAAQAKVHAAQSHVAELSAIAKRTTQDLERLKPLIAKDEISKQQYDAAVAAQQAAEAAAESAQASVSETQANVAVADARRVQAASTVAQAQAQTQAAATAPQQVAMTQARAQTAEAQVLQARAALAEARLALERTTVLAPVAGIVSRKSVEIGQVVQIGQPLLALAGLGDLWVTANFKETQLERMRPGQPVTISIDTYGQPYSGRVDSIAAATGATFSLLPPDNASGNFVKVVQRVPVKIALAAGQNAAATLRPGMSATVTVYLK